MLTSLFWCCIKVSGVFIAVLAIAAALSTKAWAGTTWAGPDSLAETESLGDVVATADLVHIVYVHGIRAEGPGAAQPLVDLLSSKLGFTVAAKTEDVPIDIGPWPKEARFFGQQIFESQEEWKAARPFVRHYTLTHATDGKEVRVDEVNYWPLLYPLKCRFLLVPEHDLSGDDKEHRTLCGSWLRPADRAELAKPTRGGRAALVNRVLKHQILNWGLSDAVVALGSMRVYLNEAMDKAFANEIPEEDGKRVRHVIMSESLGSFVVLDSVQASSNVARFFDKTDDLYFFANQVPLLELARIENVPPVPGPVVFTAPGAAPPVQPHAAAPAGPSPARILAQWAQTAPGFTPRPIRQIIAFSDPSDILTYRMPAIPGVKVVNIYDRNGPSWFGLFADPGKAHTGHLKNKAVWKLLAERRHPPLARSAPAAAIPHP